MWGRELGSMPNENHEKKRNLNLNQRATESHPPPSFGHAIYENLSCSSKEQVLGMVSRTQRPMERLCPVLDDAQSQRPATGLDTG